MKWVDHMIYVDNAATTKMDPDAFEAMKSYLISDYGNASQPYFFAKPAKKAIADARESIAGCIGVDPEEIYFTSGGTESDNWAIKGSASSDAEKRATITSQIEHHAILNACEAIERLGYPVAYLPVTNEGIVRPEKLEQYITNKTRLVSVMLANNEIGTIEPIAELARIAHAHGALFHTDAVQAVGHIPINVKDLGVDMLSSSAHKFNGMKGSGFLYIRKGIKILPYADGGAQEHGMRAGTENVAAIVAMAVALKKNCDCMEKTAQKLNKLEIVLLDALTAAGIDYRRNGNIDHLPGNVNISIKGADGEMLLHRLDLKGICISTGSACDSVNTRVSHVIEAIHVSEEYAKGTIRISFGKDNTGEEALAVANTLIDILRV
jgi:cysteine sulfinate desulfinase/cysteine desulfurase-like protein